MYNYCTEDPYSFMTINTRPTATIPFKKNFDGQIKGLYVQSTNVCDIYK